MTKTQTIYRPSGFGPLVIILGLISVVNVISIVFALIDLDWLVVIRNIAVTAICAAPAWWFYNRRRRAAVLMAPRHLISRDGANEDVEIPIADAVASIAEVTAGTTLAPMTRTLQLPDTDGVPRQKVIVVDYNGESTELYQIKGMRPPAMRQICDEINAALTAARQEYNYPEPGRST